MLDEIERGAEIIITRRARAVAKLVPATAAFDRAKAKAAAKRIIARHHGRRLGDVPLKDLIGEDRP